MSKRPLDEDANVLAVDVLGEVLEASQLTTALYGRLELGAPWQLRIPARPYLSFYVVARGTGWIELDAIEGHPAYRLEISAGDALLLPHGSPHRLRDAGRHEVTPIELDHGRCSQPFIERTARFGGDGPTTTLMSGNFTFASGSTRNPLLTTLPPLIHVPANAVSASPQLAGVVPLILNESVQPGAAASLVLARLADLLLIHALRYWTALSREHECGLHAVAHPNIGSALRLMHARPRDPWTVESLASAVAMSRSAFAARFMTLVGESPLQYLARWRMTQAARLLTGSTLSMAEVAERVGYTNPVAFAKAFARHQGVGPGGYRKRVHHKRATL